MKRIIALCSIIAALGFTAGCGGKNVPATSSEMGPESVATDTRTETTAPEAAAGEAAAGETGAQNQAVSGDDAENEVAIETVEE